MRAEAGANVDNAILEVMDCGRYAKTIAAPPMRWLEQRLQSYIAQCCLQAEHFGGYYLSLSQVELSLDLVLGRETVARELCAQLVRQGYILTSAGERCGAHWTPDTPEAEATARFNAVAEGVLCLRHWLNGQSLKIYHKGPVLRLEVTSYDLTFYKHHREVVKRDGTKEWRVAPLKRASTAWGPSSG